MFKDGINPSSFVGPRVLSIFAFALLMGTSQAQVSNEGRTHKPQPQQTLKGVAIPFPLIQKQINFKLLTLDKAKFILMASEIAILPKGFAGKLKEPQPIVVLEFGSKKGGVGHIYETLAVPGLKPEQLTQFVLESGAFRDPSRRPGFKTLGQTVEGTFVTATSASPGLVELELASLMPAKH